jgi:hypothetical protein
MSSSVNCLESTKCDAIPICFAIKSFCLFLKLFDDAVSASEVKSTLEMASSAGTACYHSVLKLLSPRLLSKNVKIKI